MQGESKAEIVSTRSRAVGGLYTLVIDTPSTWVATHSTAEFGGEVAIAFHLAEFLTKVAIPWMSLSVEAAKVNPGIFQSEAFFHVGFLKEDGVRFMGL